MVAANSPLAVQGSKQVLGFASRREVDANLDYVAVWNSAFLHSEDLGEAMQAFMKEHPVVYPIALVDVYDPPKDFETPRGLPMTYIIGPDGAVLALAGEDECQLHAELDRHQVVAGRQAFPYLQDLRRDLHQR